MKKLFAATIILSSSINAYSACVPAREVVEWPEDVPNTGLYHRVHPSGDSMLVSAAYQGGSYSAGVAIIKFGKNAQGQRVSEGVKTPMINETYPVEGNWNLLASPNNQDGMRYYKYSDVLEKNTAATPVFNDGEHNQYYHSATELPGSTAQVAKFRTMLWQGSRYRDYTVEYGADGKMKKESHTETKTACANLTQLSSPILSKDGSEVASLQGNGTAIYKIKPDSSCELVEDLKYATSKVSFSYPEAGKKGKVAFWGDINTVENGVPRRENGVFVYDRDTKKLKKISKIGDAQPSYPGFTKDGRVIYTNKTSREIVIVDPSQLKEDGTVNTNATSCIQAGSSSAAPAAPTGRGTNRQ